MDLRTIELKISRSENLPVLPEVVSAVFKTADDPSSSHKELEKLILHDPALTAKVIRVAGAPLYGVGTVPTVGRALAVLGLARAKGLLISLVLQQLVMTRQQSSLFNQKEFWSHSLAVGIAARAIGQYSFPFITEQLYCAGIMHDIGMLVMDKFCPELLDSIIANAQNTGRSLREVEGSVSAFGHEELGRILATQWRMDDLTLAAISHHHRPEESATHRDETRIIHVANLLAYETGFPNQAPVPWGAGVTEELLDSVAVPLDHLEELQVVIRRDLAEVQQTFTASSSATQRPMYSRAS